MSEGKVSTLRPAPLDIANEHGPVVFEVRLFADGHLSWKSPQSADPAMNEILFRGYFDKVRDAILAHMTGGARIIT
jgi:hypothetical protein